MNMPSRLIIDGNTVYEIEEDCEKDTAEFEKKDCDRKDCDRKNYERKDCEKKDCERKGSNVPSGKKAANPRE